MVYLSTILKKNFFCSQQTQISSSYLQNLHRYLYRGLRRGKSQAQKQFSPSTTAKYQSTFDKGLH